MLLGTILIAGGAVLIAVFGIVPEPTHSLEDLLVLFNRPAFIVYFSLLGFFVAVALIIVSGPSCGPRGLISRETIQSDPHIRMDLFTAHASSSLFTTVDPCLAATRGEPYHHNQSYHDRDHTSDGEESDLQIAFYCRILHLCAIKWP